LWCLWLKGKKEIENVICKDKDCPFHGNLKVRGKTFKEISKTKIHARLPKCMEKEIHKGDFVKIRECRPLSKIIHFVFVEKLKGSEEKI